MEDQSMSIGFIFWLLMLLWLVFWGVGRISQFSPYWLAYNGWLLFVLLFLLGLHEFGWPVHN
jgi:hypothetical protein